jgi:hypothetical protein
MALCRPRGGCCRRGICVCTSLCCVSVRLAGRCRVWGRPPLLQCHRRGSRATSPVPCSRVRGTPSPSHPSPRSHRRPVLFRAPECECVVAALCASPSLGRAAAAVAGGASRHRLHVAPRCPCSCVEHPHTTIDVYCASFSDARRLACAAACVLPQATRHTRSNVCVRLHRPCCARHRDTAAARRCR